MYIGLSYLSLAVLCRVTLGYELPSWSTTAGTANMHPAAIVGLGNFGMLGPPNGVPASITLSPPDSSGQSSSGWSNLIGWFGAGGSTCNEASDEHATPGPGYVSFVTLSARRMQTLQYYAEMFSATWLLFVALVLAAVCYVAYSKSSSTAGKEAAQVQRITKSGAYADSAFLKNFIHKEGTRAHTQGNFTGSTIGV